jgi:RHH-type proline utilization regulon transcriptional repressor/proline dehydrogenase/delta 1-pyrroline-5-carboxylate dehydrogenase
VEDRPTVELAEQLAEGLLAAARAAETPAERRARRRLAQLLADPASRSFVRDLTDQVARIRDPRRAATRFRALVHEGGGPAFAGPADRLAAALGAAATRLAPATVTHLVLRRLRAETKGVILPAEDPALAGHLRRRRHEGFRTNVNLLGEAILGEDEARRRAGAVQALLARPDVDYVSVKVSALCSQLNVLAFDHEVDRVAERLRPLYRSGAFVNLDMEEHRDLDLTVAVFRRVLDEPEFASIDAGVALQAYLPEAHGVATALCRWARLRHDRAGGRVKIRLVKGANLAMERVEAELRGWPQAPYLSKAEVDASYKRLLDLLLDPANAAAVRVGVASHNLFDVAWALGHAGAGRIEVEMLEGMADAEARAVKERAGTVVLYAPVVGRDDFQSAIAYLARRLDENTAPENFLRAMFSLEPGSPAFEAQRERFRRAVADRHTVSTASRRTQDRSRPAPPRDPDGPFANEPDTDFTLAANRRWIAGALDIEVPGVPLLDRAGVDQAVTHARWSASPAERRVLLHRVADQLSAGRGEAIATMVAETGKTILEADPEISEAIDFARYYAEATRAIEQIVADGLQPEELGPVVVVPPWNFPYSIPSGGVFAALAAGAPALLKPAPEAVATAALLVRQCWAAGVPREAVQLVPCPEDEVGQRLITHPRVEAVVLTGSWETAQLFRSWKPDLRLHAETSGKNAIVVTAAADLDAAVRDLVHSAFANAGQKCSAASLGILEASVYDDAAFCRQLADAVASLTVGWPRDLTTVVGPLIAPPSEKLHRALTTLDPGETWLVEPRRLEERLWTPGVKLGVRPGSWFHQTECFGPVLGLMRAEDLDEAIDWQNGTRYGLTGGLQSLDEADVAAWTARVDVGNAYVNRPITGAVVRRQPFGGRKRSVVGPTVKAGGPNYVLSLCRWSGGSDPDLHRWWAEEFAVAHDPSGLRAERNVLRYQPIPYPVLLVGENELARAAADLAGVTIADHLTPEVGRVRVLEPVTDAQRRAWFDAGIEVDDTPVVSHGRIELLRWVREQAVSETRHRLGNLLDDPGNERT